MSGKSESNDKEIQAANYPSRKAILMKLKTGPKLAGELAKATKMSQKIFETHLKPLTELGLVEAKARLGNKPTDDKEISLTARGREILAYVEKLDLENIEWT